LFKEESDVMQVVTELEELVVEHDVTFLLLDSREARWLPTLLAALHGKLAISVALGFDSFVVIRHGVSGGRVAEDCNDSRLVPGSQLGCYFCSDVTAPGNSTAERTLDQRCTVSRAGVSSAASGTAVELLAAIVQHPLMGSSPACLVGNDESTTVLGATPHQIRSFFSRFTQMTPTVKRFERCVACGAAVQEAYKQEGARFLFKVFSSPECLERITGLDQLQFTADHTDLWEYGDSESVSSS
uniref:ThiF domain-containing protein n=1 Tax=Gongylonema pulchrum TaxID=637853 RepID=A0A183EIK5_9BILA